MDYLADVLDGMEGILNYVDNPHLDYLQKLEQKHEGDKMKTLERVLIFLESDKFGRFVILWATIGLLAQLIRAVI